MLIAIGRGSDSHARGHTSFSVRVVTLMAVHGVLIGFEFGAATMKRDRFQEAGVPSWGGVLHGALSCFDHICGGPRL